MTSYSYQNSVIEKITFKKADNGSSRAYLEAATNTPSEQLEKITKAMCNEGWYAIPSMHDGKPALEVRGYLREQSVRDVLAKQSFTQGAPHEEKETEKSASFIEKIRGRSLQGTSLAFIAADTGYMMYGHKEGRIEDVLAGASYMAGSATMGLLGTNAQAIDEIKKQTKKLLKYAKEHDVKLDNNFTIPIVTENNKRDVFHKIIDTLQTFPSEIGNSFTGLAGALIAYSAWKYHVSPNATFEHGMSADSINKLKASGRLNMGLGASTMISGAIATLIKEKKHDPDAPEKQGLEKAWEWIQERPLSIAALGYMVSTACHAGSTWGEYNLAKKTNNAKSLSAIPYRAGFICFTIIGEILLAISSKGHGEGVKSDMSTEDSILSIAAELVAKQKPELQPALIENLSHFLGRQDVLGGKDTNVKERLEKAIEGVKNNPWAQMTTDNAVSAPAATKLASEPAAWQQKIAASQSVSPSLGA